ncbi:toll/interleukin-1 receptor domain-containing protein [Mycobacterium sp. DL99]|uniref:toll/interleukin-1 receptor domain-containing protein n=1 Tax=Mycobacterium sp. DL99 TaxID=2528957 RepID=UPI0010813DF9|nr:toll/interleukin-1 receptor domain-containing protein [Mycobacterium sp. DL99]
MTHPSGGSGTRDESNRQSQVWEAPVLDRNPILAAIERVDRDYPGGLLTGFSIYTSRSPYDHEFFVVMYFNPTHRQAPQKLPAVYQLFEAVGARRRSDLVVEDLIDKFVMTSVPCFELSNVIDLQKSFILPSRERLDELGITPVANFKRRPKVFLSHNSDRKDEVRRLQEQLLSRSVPTWFDEIDIEYGETLVSEIEKGIESSGAVIFWWSAGFLSSHWCTYELDAFIDRVARLGKSKVQIHSIVDHSVASEQIHRKVREYPWQTFGPQSDISMIATKLAPSLLRLDAPS